MEGKSVEPIFGKEFYSNGAIRSITPYINRRINGCRKEFREDGSLWIECDYKNSQKIEERVYEKDKLIQIFHYKRGKFVEGFDYRSNEKILPYREKTEEEKYQDFLASILVNGKYQPRSKEDLARLCKDTNISLGDIDTSLISNFSFLFMDSTRTNEEFAGIENWDLSNAKNLEGMFFCATHFNRDISSWNVSGVVNFSQLFFKCTNFNQPIGKWDMSSAENVSLMLCLADSFSQNLNTWNMPNLKDHFYFFGKDANKELPSWAS